MQAQNITISVGCQEFEWIMSTIGPCLNDDSLGPAVRGCRGHFDFTVAFENVVFVMVPAIAFFFLGLDPMYAPMLTAITGLKPVMVYLESRQKSKWLGWDMKQHSPEETSGIYNLGVFFWLNTLFMKGYRVILTLESLYPLDKALRAEIIHDHVAKSIENNPWKGQRYGLARLLLWTFALQLLLPVIPRATLLAASLCQPFLIHALLHYLENDGSDKNHGYGLIGATALTYGAIALSTALYWYYQERFASMVCGSLVLAVYQKTTELRTPTEGDSGALTLMNRIVLLQRELGPAFAASLAVVAVSTLTAFGIGRLLGPRQKPWMEAIETRVGVTATAIAQMKLLKMSGMTEPIRSYVQRLQVREIAIGGRWRMLLAAAATVSQVPMTVSPVITFAAATKTLNTTSIFVSISYLTLLASPLMILFQKIPQFLGAFTCLGRIQIFLERDPRFEYRQFDMTPGSITSVTPSCLSPPDAINMSIEMKSLEKGDLPHVIIEDGNFGWYENAAVLRQVNITIPRSHLTIVVGPVASGKSTLCKAILGEVLFATGSMVVLRSRNIGYCDQQPFLTNTSIRHNIIGNGNFDDKRYTSVLNATMLDQDLTNFPLGDNTVIGSSGIALSGGQRQRVAIARALYVANTDLLIFDDVLSGLDARTTDHVFRHVFGRDGLLRRRGATVILCTHNLGHLQVADHAIRIGKHGDVLEEKPLGLDIVFPDSDLGTAPALTEELRSTELAPTNSSPTVAITAEGSEARKLGDRSVFRYYIRTIGVVPLAAFVFACACNGFLNNFPRIWLTFWADDAAQSAKGSVQIHSQAYYIGIYGMLQVLVIISFTAAVVLVLGPFIRLSGSILHQRALETVINVPLQLLTTSDTGTITNYFSQDITIIDNELPMALANVVLDILGVIGMGVLIASSSPWLGLTYPAMIVVLCLIQRFYLRTSWQMRLLDLEAKSPLYTHFLDNSKGITTIRALGWIEDNIRHNHQLLNQSQRPMYLLAMVQCWLYLTLNMVVAVTATSLVGLITQPRSSSSLSGASLVTLMTLTQSLSDIVQFYAALETSISARWPSKGGIEIRGVWAMYGRSAKEYALRGIDVSIQPDPTFLPVGSTIRENLDPLGLATAEQCHEVLQATDLWDIVGSQGGLGSALSESSLSQGQKQIFSLARAMLKPKTTGSSVLLLDEFTSSVDADTERAMLAMVEREFAGCTIIMVAHRLHIVSEFCNRVLVLDRGQIVEAGDPRKLGAIGESWFANLLAAVR
ncbi:multidrug resistance [Fusarium beomiforme]|uniref:Multidrug resistance n=1 Tax=Fusarium beomiforme TaxID=44412 RepID=A0A9P5AEM5_9HYPO|nr:multidrug resistance [Fusarium beomiforme]